MKLKYIFSLLVASLVFSSCEKFLETTPTDFLHPSVYYNSEKELEYALTGVYDILGHSRLYGAYLHSRHNMEADEGFYNSPSLDGLFSNKFTPGDPEIKAFWQVLYLGTSRANVLLANVNNNTAIAESFRNRIRGEALFLRAYYYFLLVQNFGDVPFFLEPATGLQDIDRSATPSREIYEKIIEDMETAETLVDPIQTIGFGGRVSKSAVRGILARVCLNAAGEPVNDITKYEKASYWAKKVIDDTAAGHELNPDYADVFIKYAQDKYDYKESIWEVEFWGYNTGAEQEAGYLGSWIGIANTNSNNNIGYSFGRIYATGKLYRTYENGDLRRDWNIAPFRYNPDGTKSPFTTTPSKSEQYNRNAGKYRREYELGTSKGSQPTPINFPLLRFSDVLLMYAEAENEIHGAPTTDALEKINLVRRRAFGHLLPTANPLTIGNNDLPTMSKYAFFTAIVDERSRELCFEVLRRPDLIRWGMYFETMKDNLAIINDDLGVDAWQGRYSKNVSQQHIIYPIPVYELELNKKLAQHPLWK